MYGGEFKDGSSHFADGFSGYIFCILVWISAGERRHTQFKSLREFNEGYGNPGGLYSNSRKLWPPPGFCGKGKSASEGELDSSAEPTVSERGSHYQNQGRMWWRNILTTLSPFNNRLLLPPSTGRIQPAARGQDTPDKTQSPGVHSLEHKQKNSRKQVYGQAGSSRWSLANTLHTFCNSASTPDQRRANHKTPPVTKSSQGDVNLITPPMDPTL